MKPIEATLKLKRVFTLAGVGLLSLAFFGCGGGGGGTLLNPATLNIGNGVGVGSISRVGSSKALAKIDSGTLKIFSFDGELLEPKTGVSFSGTPVKITLDGDKKAAALASGVLVACLSNADGSEQYRTIFKLSEADLLTNGPVRDSTGALRKEDADGQSTVVASLLEAEVSNTIGAQVKTCQQLSSTAKAAVKEAVNTGSASRVAIDELAQDTKDAANEEGSLVNDLITISAANTTSTTQLDTFIKTGKKADGTVAADAVKVRQARNVVKAAVKLSKQAGTEAFNKNVLKASAKDATKVAASAAAIAAALEIANSGTASGATKTKMKEAAEAALTGDVKAGATSVASAVLDDVTDINTGADLDAVAAIIGAGLASSTAGDAVSKKAENALKVALASSKDKEKLLGKALEAGSNNGAAVSKIVNTGISSGANIANAVAKSGAGVKSEIAQAVEANTSVDLKDSVTILGPTSAKKSATEVLVFVADTLETGDGVYTYTWTVSGATSKTEGDILLVTPDTEGTVEIMVTQKLGVTTVAEDTHQVTVTTAAPPVIITEDEQMVIRQGGSDSIFVLAFDPEGNAITPTKVVGKGSGCATEVSGLSGSINGGKLTVEASSAVPASAAYCAKIGATANGVTVYENIAIEVIGTVPTTVSVNAVPDQVEGAAVTLSAFAIHDTSVEGSLTLTVTLNNEVVGSAVSTVSGGSTSVETELANLEAGLYFITATLNGNEDVSAFAVSPAGAPTGLAIKLNDQAVVTGDEVNLVAASSPLKVSLDLSATDATSFSASFSNDGVNSTPVVTDVIPGKPGEIELDLTKGSNLVTVTATSDAGKSVQSIFVVKVDLKREVEVTKVVLSGKMVGETEINASSDPSTGQTTLVASIVNSVAMLDADNVDGLDLDTVQGDSLSFKVYTEAPQSADVDGETFDIEVSLSQASSNRKAELTVKGATIAVSGDGFDVTGASSFLFHGVREDGSEASVEVSSIANLVDLFAPLSHGIELDLLGLRDAMKAILVDNGFDSFAGTLNSMSGTGITIEVSVTSPNFTFKTSDENFDTFRIHNITVK